MIRLALCATTNGQRTIRRCTRTNCQQHQCAIATSQHELGSKHHRNSCTSVTILRIDRLLTSSAESDNGCCGDPVQRPRPRLDIGQHTRAISPFNSRSISMLMAQELVADPVESCTHDFEHGKRICEITRSRVPRPLRPIPLLLGLHRLRS